MADSDLKLRLIACAVSEDWAGARKALDSLARVSMSTVCDTCEWRKAGEVEQVLVGGLSFSEMSACRVGNKIDAIKSYRARVGCGLREAKEACDKFGYGL
jgi:ribosomal protein L7/L12